MCVQILCHNILISLNDMSAKKTEFAEHLKAAKMPNLRIETNVAKEKIKDLPGFLKELSSALAATTGKPEQYMVVQVGFIYSFCLHCLILSLQSLS